MGLVLPIIHMKASWSHGSTKHEGRKNDNEAHKLLPYWSIWLKRSVHNAPKMFGTPKQTLRLVTSSQWPHPLKKVEFWMFILIFRSSDAFISGRLAKRSHLTHRVIKIFNPWFLMKDGNGMGHARSSCYQTKLSKSWSQNISCKWGILFYL